MGEFYSITFVGIQGHPNTNSYVKSFYLKYSPDGWRWSIYGYNPPKTPYTVGFVTVVAAAVAVVFV